MTREPSQGGPPPDHVPRERLVLRDARMRGVAAPTDIAIEDGKVVAIGPGLAIGPAGRAIDVGGRLVTPSFVNPHLHLCKVWTGSLADASAQAGYHGAGMANARSAIEIAARIKTRYAASWIAANAEKALALAALHGNLHVRAFADVDAKAGLEAVKALVAVREAFRGTVTVQVVAFPQDGLLREPGALELMRESMRLGADVVGGIPWIEHTDADAAEHVRLCFDLACEFDADVSMLLDDAGDPGLRTVEKMAIETLRRERAGRALAHHCRAMALYPTPYLERLAGLLRRAGVAVVSDPHTGPLHARVRDLLARGVTVCLGQDDISDAYYTFGRNNMLEVAFLAAHLLWMSTPADLERLYDMITVDAARAIGLADHAIAAGAPANLVVLDAPNVLEALRSHAAPLHVIADGRLLDTAALRARAAAPVQLPGTAA